MDRNIFDEAMKKWPGLVFLVSPCVANDRRVVRSALASPGQPRIVRPAMASRSHLQIKVKAQTGRTPPVLVRVSNEQAMFSAAAAAAAASGRVLGAGAVTLVDVRSPARAWCLA